MSVLLNPTFWKSIPVIIQFIFELKKFWDQKIEEDERREKLKQFKEAFKRARMSGDTSDLERLVVSFRDNE